MSLTTRGLDSMVSVTSESRRYVFRASRRLPGRQLTGVFTALRVAVPIAFIYLSFLSNPLNDERVRLLNLAGALAASLLMFRIGSSGRENGWAWAIVGVFVIGYFVKSYVVAGRLADPSMAAWLPGVVLSSASIANIRKSYRISMEAFAAVCLTCTFMASRGSGRPSKCRVAPSWTLRLLLAFLAIGIFSLLVRAELGIGFMGVVPGSRLPLRLDTAIFRLQSDVVPAFLLLAVWLAGCSGSGFASIAAVTSFIAFSAAGSVVSGSKGGLLTAALALLSLWAVGDKLTWARIGAVVACALLGALVLFPIMAFARLARHQGVATISEAWHSGVDHTLSAPVSLDSAVTPIILRVTGADGLWVAADDVPQELSLHRVAHFIHEPIMTYYTRQVFGETDPATFRSPGIVAALLLIGGPDGLVVFVILYVVGVSVLWRLARHLRTSAVAKALVATFAFGFTMEGTLQLQMVIALLFNIAAVEFVFRTLTPAANTKTWKTTVNRPHDAT